QMFLSIRKMAGDLGEDVGTDTPDIVQAVAIKGTQKIGLKWKLTLVMAFYGITMLMIGWLMVENISGMDTVQIILTMFPIITIGALIFGIYFGKKLVDVRPIVEMAEAARKVKNGDLNVSVKEDGNDEIADLAKAFNQMILSVRFVVGSMDEKESMS
ncbi:MAG: HAMP domain-containing protein, partial [Thermoplasmata archaeon]|nr:HAMP domain-containing protein [Thermoplasmata archaeon]